MHKLFFVLLLLCNFTAQAKINIFACEPEWASLAEELTGEHAKIFTATNAFQDPHHIEARPSLIAKTRRSDLVICTGSELEIGWLPLLIRQSGNKHIQEDQAGYFMAAEQVERIEIPTELDRSLGDIHAGGNPHVHLDPRRLLQIARILNTRLQSLDPDNTSSYQENFLSFKKRWLTAIEKWESLATPLKGKKVIVYHRDFSYLLEWLGIVEVGDLEPKPGLPPTSKHLAQLLQKLKQVPTDLIILPNYKNKRGANWLAKKSNVSLIPLPYTVGGNKEAQDLFSLYDNTIHLLLGK